MTAARRRLRRMLLLALVPVAAACTTVPPVVMPGPPPGRAPARPTPARASDGVDLVPLRVSQFIFGLPVVDPQIQPSSRVLASIPASSRRLHVTALPSGAGTSALGLVEDSPPGHRWGELMTPALRRVFRSFARDRTLGQILVIVDDIHVLRGVDPVPMTAYRWTRVPVERYARCGIPLTGIDACTSAFYLTPEVVFIPGNAGRSGF